MDDIGWLCVGFIGALILLVFVVCVCAYIGCCWEASALNERLETDFTGWELFIAGKTITDKIIGDKRELDGKIIIERTEGG